MDSKACRLRQPGFFCSNDEWGNPPTLLSLLEWLELVEFTLSLAFAAGWIGNLVTVHTVHKHAKFAYIGWKWLTLANQLKATKRQD